MTEYPELEKARKLHAFYGRNGYADLDCRYTLGGRECALMYLPIAGPKDVSRVVRSVVRSVYACLYSEQFIWRYINIEKDGDV